MFFNKCIQYCNSELTPNKANIEASSKNSFIGTKEEERKSRLLFDVISETLKNNTDWQNKSSLERFNSISNNKEFITKEDFETFFTTYNIKIDDDYLNCQFIYNWKSQP